MIMAGTTAATLGVAPLGECSCEGSSGGFSVLEKNGKRGSVSGVIFIY